MTNPFDAWAARGFTAALLPIIPPGSVLSVDSAIPPSQVGKVPGVRKHDDTWAGLVKWRGSVALPEDLPRWGGMGAGVGLQAALFPALDIDVTDAELSAQIQALAARFLGAAPGRIGRAPKLLMVYRVAGETLPKRKVRFALGDTTHIVEFLGDGQQYVVEGTHPGTGRPYEWPNGLPVAATLPVVTAEALDRFYVALADLLDMIGATEIRATRIQAAGPGASEAADQVALRAPSASALASALAMVKNEGGYDEWIAMACAIRAAAAGLLDDDGQALWLGWTDRWEGGGSGGAIDADAKWRVLPDPPYLVGWGWIEAQARAAGWTGGVALDFAGIDAPILAPRAPRDAGAGGAAAGIDGDTLQDAMFRNWRWIEATKRFGCMTTGDMLDREQFNVRLAAIGAPHDRAKCAAAVFLADTERCRTLAGLTFHPGGEREVVEPGLGRCFNRWRASDLVPAVGVTDAQVAPWAEHVARLWPDAVERGAILDVMAHMLQRPAVKINHALVLGGLPGIGKDTAWAPVIEGIGRHNVAVVSMTDIEAPQNDWCAGAQAVFVNEVHSGTRVAFAERMKPYIAAPPMVLRVNTKNVPQYYIPNRLVMVMFTNRRDAISIERGDRRYCVIWSLATPMDGEYFRRLWAWFAGGGAAAVVGWLLARDLARFDAAGRPVDTVAKAEMAMDARGDGQAAVEDAIDAGELPDVVSPEDVAARLNGVAGGSRGRGLTGRAVAVMLRQRGARSLNRGNPVALLAPTKTGAMRARLWAIRDFDRYDALPGSALARIHAEGWIKLEGGELILTPVRAVL